MAWNNTTESLGYLLVKENQQQKYIDIPSCIMAEEELQTFSIGYPITTHHRTYPVRPIEESLKVSLCSDNESDHRSDDEDDDSNSGDYVNYDDLEEEEEETRTMDAKRAARIDPICWMLWYEEDEEEENLAMNSKRAAQLDPICWTLWYNPLAHMYHDQYYPSTFEKSQESQKDEDIVTSNSSRKIDQQDDEGKHRIEERELSQHDVPSSNLKRTRAKCDVLNSGGSRWNVSKANLRK